MRFITAIVLAIAAISSVNAQGLNGVLTGESPVFVSNATNTTATTAAPSTVIQTTTAPTTATQPLTGALSSSQSNNVGALSSAINNTGIAVSNLATCNVIDPTRAEKPWANSTQAFPQVYDANTYVCVNGNFLCPSAAPLVCGTLLGGQGCYSSTQYYCQNNVLIPVNGTASNTTTSSLSQLLA